MRRTTLPIKPNARAVIRCSDDLSVEGIEASTLNVIVDQGETLKLKEENNVFIISADSACRILLPANILVTLEKVGGDVYLSNMNTRIVICKVSGDVHLQKIGRASVESVGGDCTILHAKDEIEMSKVGGSLFAEDIQALSVGSVGDEIKIMEANGKVEVTAGSDVSIAVGSTVLPRMQVRAGSDINLLIPQWANAQLNLRSGEEEITVHAGDQNIELEKSDLSLAIGEGGSQVALTAGGCILVSDQEVPDWGNEVKKDDQTGRWANFGIEIEQRMNTSMQMITEKFENAARSIENVSNTHFINKIQKPVGFAFADNSSPTPESDHALSDEERLMVLRMLQEKKINVEEAEKLLSALDR